MCPLTLFMVLFFGWLRLWLSYQDWKVRKWSSSLRNGDPGSCAKGLYPNLALPFILHFSGMVVCIFNPYALRSAWALWRNCLKEQKCYHKLGCNYPYSLQTCFPALTSSFFNWALNNYCGLISLHNSQILLECRIYDFNFILLELLK